MSVGGLLSNQSVFGTARRIGAFNPIATASLGVSALAWGPSTAAAYAAASLAHPLRRAVVDDYGVINYLQLELRTSRVAAGLLHRGVDRDQPVGLLCRNHRGFVEANVALAKLGTRVVYLNPGLPPPQLRAVIERESVGAVVVDTDLLGLLSGVDPSVIVMTCAPELDPSWSFPGLARWRPLLQMPNPLRSDDPVVLTSGTTGAPKGTTRRANARSASAVFGVLEAIPYSRGDVTVLAAPLFHAWGLSQLLLAASMAGTVVLRRSFDPATVLDDVEANGADVLAVVPVMLHRMVDAAAEADLSTLRIVASSGSALPGDLAARWMEVAGPTLYSLYGSTEVGQISVAGPTHLLEDPASGGCALRGVSVAIVDDAGQRREANAVGRVVVASAMHFDAYTDGDTREMVNAFMDTGDLGRLNDDGLLTIVGRADDMIISGGENVFPVNIERALLAADDVDDAVVVGVADPDLGQRVRAVVVRSSGKATNETFISSLRRELRSSLASHEVPREFLVVDHLPRNGAGKVLRAMLSANDLDLEALSSSLFTNFSEPTVTDARRSRRARRKVTP